MKKILDLVRPTITAYPGRAHIYALLENNEQYNPWLMENFIQTESLFVNSEDKLIFDIDFFNVPKFQYSSHTALSVQSIFCPCIQLFAIPSEIVQEMHNSILDWVISSIDRNYYITMTINEKYIQAYGQNQDDLHNILIHGYDMNQKVLYIADFFGSRKYDLKECSFEEFDRAVSSVDSLQDIQLDTTTWNEVKTVSYFKPDLAFYPVFHIENFKLLISDYIGESIYCEKIFSSTNNWKTNEGRQRRFGNMYYDNMRNYLSECEKRNRTPDIMTFHIAYEHKLSIQQRINYLLNNNYIHDVELPKVYNEVVKKCLSIRNALMRYHIMKRCPDTVKFCENIAEIKQLEKEILSNLIQML